MLKGSANRAHASVHPNYSTAELRLSALQSEKPHREASGGALQFLVASRTQADWQMSAETEAHGSAECGTSGGSDVRGQCRACAGESGLCTSCWSPVFTEIFTEIPEAQPRMFPGVPVALVSPDDSREG